MVRFPTRCVLVASLLISISGTCSAKAGISLSSMTVELSHGRHPIPFCHGLVSDRFILTAQHCLTDAATAFPGEVIQVTLSTGERVDLPLDRLHALYHSPYAEAMKSFDNDFVVIPLDAQPKRPVDAPPMSNIARALEGETVTIYSSANQQSICHIRSVCGSELFYDCDTQPVQGMSGSGIWTTRRGRETLLGIHTREPDEGTEYHGTDATTLFGRSSFLFPATRAFSQIFARMPTFRYTWGRLCVAKPPFRVEVVNSAINALPKDAAFHGLLVHANVLLTADLANQSLCTFRIGAATTTLTDCGRAPVAKPSQINTLLELSDGTVAAGEAELPSPKGDVGKGAISFLNWNMGTGALSVSATHARAVGNVKSIRALLEVGADIIAGGEEGVCLVSGSTCSRVGDAWRVNGLLKLSDNSFLAVGQYRELGKPVRPSCRWYERAEAGWHSFEECKLGADLLAAAASFATQGRELAFKAPVLIDGSPIVFSSDGRAFILRRGRPPKLAVINGIMGIHAPGSDQFDDGARDAVLLAPNLVMVGANDGGIHFLLRDNLGFSFNDYTLQNRGLWMTALARGQDWAAAISADQNLSIIRWSGDLPSTLKPLIAASMLTGKLHH